MKLEIKNIGKIIESGISFNWVDIVSLPDRYQFHIESNDTQNIYYLDLYRFDEHKNGTYRLMINNVKYKSYDNKLWVMISDIQDIVRFKRICRKLICSVAIEELPF
jgi:hypothetical protein